MGNELKYGFTVIVTVEGAPPVLASASQLLQIVINLLVNARQAMGETGTVTIGATWDETIVTCAAADTGPGIPDEVLPRIFDPFFTTKPVGEGTGMGLSIVHGLVESFGGSIGARNVPEGGAEISVQLRRAAVDRTSHN